MENCKGKLASFSKKPVFKIIAIILALILGILISYLLIIKNNAVDSPEDVTADEAEVTIGDSLDSTIEGGTTETLNDAEDSTEQEDEFIPFNAYHFLPGNQVEFDVFELDFENDGVSEYALIYEVDNVSGGIRSNCWGCEEYEVLRDIDYLKVYKWNGHDWEVIKEDQVNNSGGSLDQFFGWPEVMELGDEGREYLLITKRQRKYSGTYYIFGLTKEGEYDDLAIQKGYLNQEKYLGDDDLFVNGGIQILDSGALNYTANRIVEKYGVYCEDREAFGAGRETCWSFELWIPFEDGMFGDPTMTNIEDYR